MKMKRTYSVRDVRRPKGFTLIEILLAVIVTAVVGLCVVTVTGAMFSAMEASNDSYGCVQTGRVLTLRLSKLVRCAQLVTDVSDDASAMMIWEADRNGDRAINLTELIVISWDAQNEQLQQDKIEFPSNWSESVIAALDVNVPLSQARISSSTLMSYYAVYGSTQPLADGITAFSVQTDVASPMTEVLGVHLSVERKDQVMAARRTSTLRASQVHRVTGTEGSYVLSE
jgi:prepilin-type N-terminal cleavage/methylation domain-containing protein